MKLRPQVLVAILALASAALYSLYLGHIEVSTVAVGGIIAVAGKLVEPDA